MGTLPERFRYLDPRFFPYLERILNRVPPGVKEDILKQDDFQRSEGYKVGYKWAKRQNKDYLVQHFGLYFDQWNTKGWGQGSEELEKEIERRNGASSLLEELAQARIPVPSTAKGKADTSSVSPRRAVLAGIMSALKEMELQERYDQKECEMARK